MNIEIMRLCCDSTIEKYDIIEFDIIKKKWVKANNNDSFIGVVVDDIVEIDSMFFCFASFSGEQEAKNSRQITVNGGSFLVENGKLYLSDSLNDKYRYILPVAKLNEISEGSVVEDSRFISIDSIDYLKSNNIIKFVF